MSPPAIDLARGAAAYDDETEAPAGGGEAQVPSGDVPLRGGGLLRRLESPVRRLEALLARWCPERWNPLAMTGAVSTLMLFVATATGILLLPFYSASPRMAHASVEAMMAAPLTLGLLRSLHRYSSDATVLFGLIHLVRLLLARRLGGPRALAWATGACMLAIVIVVGWLGYWLVWDEAGALVARETAGVIDSLRLFGEPIARSFLTDEGLSATLFFVVFFAHMLLPLALAVLLWVHVMRLQRVKLLPRRGLTLVLIGGLIAASLLAPAPLGPAAFMATMPEAVRIDAWYVAPLALSKATGPGLALALVAGATLLLAALPWLLQRKKERRPAEVMASSCNACSQCVTDCPYGAISLVPRAGLPGRAELVAQVDPARCVGCGLCSASCEPGGIGLPWTTSVQERTLVDNWVSACVAAGEAPIVAWICEEVASPSLQVNPRTGRCGVTGVLSLVVPCAGFVHSLTIERALRRGARGVLVLSCPDGACRYREGTGFLRERLLGLREPALRTEKLDASRIRVSEHGVVDAAVLQREAQLLRADDGGSLSPAPARRGRIGTALLAVLVACGIPMLAVSDLRLPLQQPASGELVVSFRHPGQIAERCRDLSPEEIASLPPHMRKTRECRRERIPVRLRVSIDGRAVHESEHAGAGLWSDGESVAVVTLAPPPGTHRVTVELGDSPDASEMLLHETREMTFERGLRRVVLYDRKAGFSWK